MLGKLFILPLVLLGLAACAETFAPDPAPAPAALNQAPPNPALAAISSAGAGAVGLVDDPALGGQVEINVLTTYRAASGRDCKRVAIRRVGDGAQFSRVACAGPSGWYWSAASLT